jgi:hypothetical protein
LTIGQAFAQNQQLAIPLVPSAAKRTTTRTVSAFHYHLLLAHAPAARAISKNGSAPTKTAEPLSLVNVPKPGFYPAACLISVAS